MTIYESDIIVTKNDLDELNHVNNVRYVQWINDIAKAHWLQEANKDLLQNYFWVVISHHINYKGSAFLDDILTLKTYVKKSEGVTSSRIVEIFNKETNKLLVTSETNYCCMNAQTERPCRITQEITDLFQ